MILEKFNDRTASIEFDHRNGSGKLLPRSHEQFSGIGDEFQNGFVALFVLDGKLYLQVEDKAFDFSRANLTLEYSHTSDITNVRIADSGQEVFSTRYPVWWLKHEAVPAGLGVDDDDEHDFFAYAKIMTDADNRKQHLIRKYT